ncbi:MAG TPA: DUF4954 family protein, partial [Chitinophagaceae bacterium]|nr:DUF4954 family protein [Chitinophagaceae bacterium]
HLSAFEIESLVRNRNTSDNWNNILVSDSFNPELVKNCQFHGLVRIGSLESVYLEFHNLRMPVGLYNSTIISCDIGDNISIDNVNYISHYVIGNEVIIVNVNELNTTDHAKFGNGIVKEGESEKVRIWLEVCNENGGRNILPFEGMLSGDAFLWSRNRDDQKLQKKFSEFTDKRFDLRRGYYGQIGDRTIIKNTAIIKDVWIGSDAYIKGANKLKNLTINSSAEAKSQIGEGCELVNGIVDYGCRIFYGVKAVRFVLSSHSQLKYGARLINSFLGNNSTISCCEVLNSLIFPSHEQHHNNSFLCAATVLGQSNMAAGATIGSNHNSRSADGELVAGRGFWPGLCVSLKHNSVFASFCILAKGDYPSELNIPIPFSLISNDQSKNELIIMPAYWFQYNMYALARNSWKYGDRDKRTDKTQLLEFDFIAPDTINEMLSAIQLFEKIADKRRLAANDKSLDKLDIFVDGFENGSRKVRIIKIREAYRIFRDMIEFNLANQLLNAQENGVIRSLADVKKLIPAKLTIDQWENVGGQLIRKNSVDKLLAGIRSGKMKSWDDVHAYYIAEGENYDRDKLIHGIAVWQKVNGIDLKKKSDALKNILQKSIGIKEWMTASIKSSRLKDYKNPFRKMVYESDEEMNAVIGNLKGNSFIKDEEEKLKLFKRRVTNLMQ